jgi:hypothetical protein
MRAILLLLSGFVAAVSGLTNRTSAPAFCFVANTAVIWYGDPDYKIHRIVTTGIRRYDDAGNSTMARCAPKDSADLVANRQALVRVIDTLRIDPPRTMTRMELTAQSSKLIESQLVSLDAKAKAHSDDFSNIEIVEVRKGDGSEVPEVALPTLSKTPPEAAACTARSDSLRRAGARVRPAC